MEAPEAMLVGLTTEGLAVKRVNFAMDVTLVILNVCVCKVKCVCVVSIVQLLL